MLWTRDVNLTLDANKEAIMKLYMQFAQNYKNKRMHEEDAIKLMTKSSKLKVD
jgi:hypothetical protein